MRLHEKLLHLHDLPRPRGSLLRHVRGWQAKRVLPQRTSRAVYRHPRTLPPVLRIRASRSSCQAGTRPDGCSSQQNTNCRYFCSPVSLSASSFSVCLFQCHGLPNAFLTFQFLQPNPELLLGFLLCPSHHDHYEPGVRQTLFSTFLPQTKFVARLQPNFPMTVSQEKKKKQKKRMKRIDSL